MAATASSSGGGGGTGASSITTNGGGKKQQRSFTIFRNNRTRFTLDNVMDGILNACTFAMEKIVLLLGPMLIIFASVIISGLTHTFFTVVLPMLQRYHLGHDGQSATSMSYVCIAMHIIYVVFVLSEIVFNYFMCVTTSNKGKNNDLVARELALATNFDYPETPQEIEQFRRDYEDKMLLRIKRRQMRSSGGGGTTSSNSNNTTNTNGESTASTIANNSEQQAQDSLTLPSGNGGGTSVTVTQRKKGATKQANKKKLPNPKQVRNWMLMAHDEWGYCQRTKQPKPPRSHYDHVTKSLVMNLDHYCPWMFNTIGYFNYRYFCNFLWFVVMAMAYGAAVTFVPFQNCSGPLYAKQKAQWQKTGQWTRLYDFVPTRDERMPISMSFMLCLAVGIAVACLGGFHLYLCLTAQTTIEFHGNWMNRRKAKKLNKKWKNPYDLGYKRNWQQIYGSSRTWFWALIIPSTRQPEFLPLPIPGDDGRRRKCKQDNTKTGGESPSLETGAAIV